MNAPAHDAVKQLVEVIALVQAAADALEGGSELGSMLPANRAGLLCTVLNVALEKLGVLLDAECEL